MNKNLSQIVGAFAITVSNRKIMALFVLFNMGHLVAYIQSEEINKITTYLLGIIGLFSIPLIYASYFEKIYEINKKTLIELTGKYLIKFYLLGIIVALPMVLAMILNIFTKSSFILYAYFILSFAISIAELYILPHFFKTTLIIESIKTGLYFLKKNINISHNLIGMTLLLAILNHYLEYSFYGTGYDITLFKSIVGFSLSLFQTILMFSIFVLASITYRSLEDK